MQDAASERRELLGRLLRIDDSQTGQTNVAYDGNAMVAEYDAPGNLLRFNAHGSNAEAEPVLKLPQ